MPIPHLLKVCRAIKRLSLLEPIGVMIRPYLSINTGLIHILAFGQRSDGFVILKQKARILKWAQHCRDLMGWSPAHETGIRKWMKRHNWAPTALTSLYIATSKSGQDLQRFRSHRSCALLLFATLLTSVTKALDLGGCDIRIKIYRRLRKMRT